MDQTHETSPAVEELVDGLMQSYGQLALILDHMQRHENPDGPPIPLVLAGLLTDLLGELHGEFGEDDVATAAQILRTATDLVSENVFLANPDELLPPPPPPPPGNRTQRRAKNRRRGH